MSEAATTLLGLNPTPVPSPLPSVNTKLLEADALEGAPVRRKSFSERTWGPMAAGSQRGSVLALASTAFGGSMVTLPWVFATLGGPLTVLLVLLAGIANYASMWLLINLSFATDCQDYGEAMAAALGKRAAGFLDICIGLYAWGAIAGALVLLQGFGPILTKELGFPHWLQGPRQTVFMIVISSLPLLLTRSLTSLRYPMAASVAGVLTIGVVVLWGLRTRPGELLEMTDLPWSWWVDPRMTSWEAVPQGIAMIISSYNCHISIFSAKRDLKTPTPTRMNKVLMRATSLQWLFYSCIAVAGGAASPWGLPAPQLRQASVCRIGASPVNMLSAPEFGGWECLMCRLFMSFALWLALPINLHAARSILERRLLPNSGSSRQTSVVVHVILTLALLASGVIFGLIFHDLASLMSIFGGGFATTFMFAMPIAATWSFTSKGDGATPFGSSKQASVAVAIVFPFLVVGYLSAALTLWHRLAAVVS
eukprot:CAMPEP_0206623608 /NCGR_PEP_ID=MMETSP0325_2-20121206/63578_1 /ASSEMBLY_ACC=CAM_ASM_000347 /TAXON_ID=2866 /ORGANISM="Crypthecodinium cohnii, Strain Seligo" /LENGTH=479 /DNA_ID=CAMNT_0054147307 /DNA_START=94 /DNA_END=1532 /DNA_ORIENTATION=+